MSRYTPAECGEGWEAFQKQADVASLIEDGVIEEPAAYGFASEEELAQYVQEQEYAPDRAPVVEIDCQDPSLPHQIHQPKDEQDEYDPMQPPKCHRCLDERTERAMYGGLMDQGGEGVVDPNAIVEEHAEESQSAIVGAETRTVYRTVASCPEHDKVWFAFETRRHE